MGWVLQPAVLVRCNSPILVGQLEALADEPLSCPQMLEKVMDVHALLHVLVNRAQYTTLTPAYIAAFGHLGIHGKFRTKGHTTLVLYLNGRKR